MVGPQPAPPDRGGLPTAANKGCLVCPRDLDASRWPIKFAPFLPPPLPLLWVVKARRGLSVCPSVNSFIITSGGRRAATRG